MVHFLSCNPRGPGGAALGNVASVASVASLTWAVGQGGLSQGWGQGGQVSLLPCHQVFCSGAALNCIQLPWCLGGRSVNGIHLLF